MQKNNLGRVQRVVQSWWCKGLFRRIEDWIENDDRGWKDSWVLWVYPGVLGGTVAVHPEGGKAGFVVLSAWRRWKAIVQAAVVV